MNEHSHPRNFILIPTNDALEHVSPFIYGYFGYLSNTYQEGSDMI